MHQVLGSILVVVVRVSIFAAAVHLHVDECGVEGDVIVVVDVVDVLDLFYHSFGLGWERYDGCWGGHG